MVGAPGSRGGWGVAETASRIRCRYALVAQWIEHLTTDQKVVGSTPAERTNDLKRLERRLPPTKLFAGQREADKKVLVNDSKEFTNLSTGGMSSHPTQQIRLRCLCFCDELV